MASKSIDPDNGSNNDDINETKRNGDTTNVDNGNGDIIDPAGITGDGFGDGFGDEYERDGNGELVIGANGKPRKRRGRKPTGTNRGRSKRASRSSNKTGSGNNKTLDGVDTLSKVLFVFHLGIANATKFDDFALDESEANNLAEATATVMDEFDVTPDPRFVAIAGLLSVAGQIYVPRYYLYQQFKKEKKKDKPATVTVSPTPAFDPENKETFYGNLAG